MNWDFGSLCTQGGEDGYYTEKTGSDDSQVQKKLSGLCPDTSVGEKSEESYRAYKEAGADRYLLQSGNGM